MGLRKIYMSKLLGLLTFLLALLFSETVLGSEAQINKFCKKNYGKKLTTFERCVLSQKSAKRFIKRSKADNSIKIFCKKKNPINLVKRKYCISTQANAKAEMETYAADLIIRYICKEIHKENMVSQRNCVWMEIQ